MKTVRLGILGLGTVGSGLVELVARNAEMIQRRSEVQLEIVKALVRNPDQARPLDAQRVTTTADDVLNNPDVDVVVELIGGIEPARTYILRALEAGKDIVTANKAVLAAHGDEIIATASTHRRQVGFEASVCGGIPIIQALSSGLIANRVDEFIGILNGTSNYVLTRMSEEGEDYGDALADAQAAGLAEADPSFDVRGIDAAHKLLILTELTFQVKASLDEITVEGIDTIERIDIKTAQDFGFVIKPLGVAKKRANRLDLRVHPALIPSGHPLANVKHEFNAVMVKGDAIGEMTFYGKGAGSLPTASAVLSDIVEIARSEYAVPVWNPQKSIRFERVDSESRYYLRFPIVDQPGIIGRLATVLGNHGISITHAHAVLVCDETNRGNVMIITHSASEREVDKALREIVGLEILTAAPISLRIL
jgi:homoserine dehydrogenase